MTQSTLAWGQAAGRESTSPCKDYRYHFNPLPSASYVLMNLLTLLMLTVPPMPERGGNVFEVSPVEGCRRCMKMSVGINEFVVVNLMCNIGLVSVCRAVSRY